MKISLVRTGGVTGMRRAVLVDTAELDPARAREIERLVEAANLERLSQPKLAAERQPDCFRYTLTVEQGHRKHSFLLEEHRIPESLQPLVEAVWRQGSPGPGTVTV